MRRRNDAPWRRAALAKRGERCRACGSVRAVQCDHIIPRSQGGRSDVENGLPLCEPHHRAKTESRIVIRYEWLDPDQIEYLAAQGWVGWDSEGEPFGRGWRHFGHRPSIVESPHPEEEPCPKPTSKPQWSASPKPPPRSASPTG